MERGELSRGRKLTAALGMLGTSSGLIYILARDGMRPSPLVIVFSALITASGFALTRGPVLAQILARGVAWLVMFPVLAYIAGCVVFGRLPELDMVALAATTGIALLAARPSLTTPAARKDFAPKAWRRLFLTGGTITAGTGIGMAAVGLAETTGAYGSLPIGLGLLAIAASMLGSVVGVMRMRGWGVLLGGVLSLVLFGIAALGPAHMAFGWCVLALPTLLGFIAPIVLARLGLAPAPAPTPTPASVGTSSRLSFEPAHVRVAVDGELDADLDEAATAPRKMELRA